MLILDMVDCIPCFGVGGKGGMLRGILPPKLLSIVSGAQELLLTLVVEGTVLIVAEGLAKLNLT